MVDTESPAAWAARHAAPEATRSLDKPTRLAFVIVRPPASTCRTSHIHGAFESTIS